MGCIARTASGRTKLVDFMNAHTTGSHEENVRNLRHDLMVAALGHVPFEGWSDKCVSSAAEDLGIDLRTALEIVPGGARDIAAEFHLWGDRKMERQLLRQDFSQTRYSERIAEAVWLRMSLVGEHQLVVRRSTALFSLPNNSILGGRLLWGTADLIWNALGDTSTDGNWYTKRATLSAVVGSTVMYWIGDSSEGFVATREFVDRRIANVMRFEQFKSRVRESRALRPVTDRMAGVMERMSRPAASRNEYPGWKGRTARD